MKQLKFWGRRLVCIKFADTQSPFFYLPRVWINGFANLRGNIGLARLHLVHEFRLNKKQVSRAE